jgi:hypothetical protein
MARRFSARAFFRFIRFFRSIRWGENYSWRDGVARHNSAGRPGDSRLVQTASLSPAQIFESVVELPFAQMSLEDVHADFSPTHAIWTLD